MAARINAPAGWNPVTWLMDWIRLLMMALRPRREIIQIKVVIDKAHHGEKALLSNEDALTVQPSMASVLGSINAAFIVQKLHEWMEYNKSQDSQFHFRDGKWWTYNSYPEWKKNHFGWMSVSKISRIFRDLESRGILRSGKYRSHKGDQRKWYTLDYDALNAAVAKWNHDRAKMTGHDSKMESSSRQNGTMNQQGKTSKQQSPIVNFQSNNSSLPLWEPRPLVSAVPAAGGRTYPPEDHLPGDAQPEETPPIRDVPASPPGSALPPSPIASPLVDEIVAAWNGAMTAKTAQDLITAYGESRVRGVFSYTRRGKFDNPPGFMISELRENKYGIAPVEASTPVPQDDEPLDDDLMPDTEPLPAAAAMVAAPFDEHWHTASQQLELLLDRSGFDAWLRKAKFVAVEGNTYTIAVHSSYARDMLQHRLYRNVRRVLSDVRGEPVEIQFVIDEGVQDAA